MKLNMTLVCFSRGLGVTTLFILALISFLACSALQSWADQGGTRGTAATVSLPSDTAAALTAGDTDYFQITVPASGRLEVQTSGGTDTVGRLENSGGRRLTGDNNGGTSGNFWIQRDVGAGTYYLRVRGHGSPATGSYTLHVRLETKSLPDEGGTRETAKVVPLPSETPAELTAGDTDYFQITVPASGRLEVQTSGGTDTLGRLETSSGRKLVENDDSGEGRNFRIVLNVYEGTYYVRVRGYGGASGSYTLSTRFTKSAPPDQGGTRGAAAIVEVPSETPGVLTAGDIDYFRIKLPTSGRLEVHTSGRTDTLGLLETFSGSQLATSDNGGANQNFRIALDVDAGIYYIRVSGYLSSSGSYTLHVGFDRNSPLNGDHSDTWRTATLVPATSETAGTLTAGDTDYFRISVPNTGRLEAYTSGNTGTLGRLENSARFHLASDDGGANQNFRIALDVAAGTHYIRVRGFDGATGSYTLHVSFERSSPPDHGGTLETAEAVLVPSETAGSLAAGDVDYFRITVQATDRLEVYTSGSADTVGRLERSNGSRLAVDSDSGEGRNFRIALDVSPGTYYVRVTGKDAAVTGSYTLHVRLVKSLTDQGGTRETASDVSVPSNTPGDLTEEDVDYFRIDVPASGRLEVHTSGGTDTFGWLESSDGAGRLEDRGSGEGWNFRITLDVSPGTYYVRVTGREGDTGSYTLHVRLEESSSADHGGTRETATRVSLPSETSGALTAGDIDYFRIDVPSSGSLEVYTSGSTDTYGRLESSGGSRLAHNNGGGNDGWDGENFRIALDVSAGTYYVQVKSLGSFTTGSYTLHARFEGNPSLDSDDQGDERESAAAVAVPSETSGALTAEDVDYFRIAVQAAGRLEVYSSGGTDTYGLLEDSGGEVLTSDDDGGANQNFRIDRDISAGTYYVRVTGRDGDTGTYTLHVLLEESSPPDQGGTRATAETVSLPSDTAASLTTGDRDYFRIEVRTAGRLTVYSSGGTDTVGRLERSNGSRLATDNDGGEGRNFRVARDVSAGTYYLQVRGRLQWAGNSNSTGAYTLRARFEASSPPPPPGDDQGSTRGTAETVSLPSETDAGLTAGDVDYFRINVRSSGRLTVHSSGGVDTVGRLEDSGGSRLATDNDGGAGRNFRVVRDVEAGTYYIMVRGRRSSTGSYTLHARFGDSPSSALGAPLASLARRTMNEVSNAIGERMSGDGGDGFAAFAGLAGDPGGCAAFGTPAECAGRSLGQAGVRSGSVGTDGRPASLTLADLRGLVRNQGFSVSLGRPAAEGPGARFAPGGAAAGDGPRLTLWGGGGGSAPGGALFLGMDAAVDGRWTAGLAFAESEGTAALSGGDASARGFAETRLSAVYPYARASLGGGLTLWGIAGSGRGTVDGLWSGEAPSPGPADLPEAGRAPPEGSVRLGGGLAFGMGLVGAERTLHRGGGLDVSAAGDAGWARLSVESGAAAGASASVTRARMGLRMRYASPDGGWTGGLRLGARADGGDGETGSGLEASGEAARGWGRWRAGAEGRWYSAGVSGSRGVSATLAMARRGDGTGLGFSLSQGWGAETAGLSGKAGAAGLLPAPAETAKAADGRPAAWIGGRAAWGAKLPGPGRRLLAPHAALRLERGGGRHLRAGIDLGAFGGAAGLAFETRRTGAAEADVYAVTLRLSAGF